MDLRDQGEGEVRVGGGGRGPGGAPAVSAGPGLAGAWQRNLARGLQLTDRVLLPEPFLGYRCNLRGCCCGGWGITWSSDDLARLARHLPGPEMEDLASHHLEYVLDDDQTTVLAARLKVLDPNDRCPLLGEDGRCTVHHRFGVQAMPGICVDFPVVPYRFRDRVELAYRLTCPAVMEQVMASPEPISWVEMTTLDDTYRSRLTRIGDEPEIRIDGRAVDMDALAQARALILDHLDRRDRPALELIAEVEFALSRVRGPGDLERFEVTGVQDASPFVRYLYHAVETSGVDWLIHNLTRFDRFVEHMDLAAMADELAPALDAWAQGLVTRVDPVEQDLRPYVLRYAWVQYASALVRRQGEFLYSFGDVVHEFAAGLRYLSAMCLVLDRPAGPDLFQVAFGAAAHLYHTNTVPVSSQVWFYPEHFQDDRPPPKQVPEDVKTELVTPDP